VHGRLALYDLIDEAPEGWVITEKGKVDDRNEKATPMMLTQILCVPVAAAASSLTDHLDRAACRCRLS
jgi:hypothetical protein